MKFRKKPVVIEAIQWTGENTAEVMAFARTNPDTDREIGYVRPNAFHDKLSCNTDTGYADVMKGDWVIKGIKGEFYPCKPEIFDKTYDPAE